MTPFRLALAALVLTLSGAVAHAASATGTVNNKTTGKPSSGDTVELIDVQNHMSAAEKTTSDASGHYSLNLPGPGPYLIRVTHHGAPYFIAAGGPSGDVTVYDVKAKVDGVSVEADVFEMETTNGQLTIDERFLVHNASSPPTTQYGPQGFEFVLPEGAILDSAEVSRPGGLPTNATPKKLSAKGHYSFDVPIDPDKADKSTMLSVQYHLNAADKYTFHPQFIIPTDNLAVLLPKGMSFVPGQGTSFQPVHQDPSIQTYVMKAITPGKSIDFTVSGTGNFPREAQGADAQSAQSAAPSGPGGGPGGGIGEPINTPDPLSKYKWWILGGVGLLLAAVAAFLLRKPAGAEAQPAPSTAAALITAPTTPADKNAALLTALKEELFSLESAKLSGTIPQAEYETQKAALETVLKSALSRKS